MIIHINGWPGAGKKTIGQILSRSLDALFVHNHLLHDVAIVCAGLNSPDRWQLYETVRSAAYSILAQKPTSKTFVMTNALCNESSREQAAWKHVVNLAMTRNVPLVPVVLDVRLEENCRRLQSTERQFGKLTDTKLLREMLDEATLQRPDISEFISIPASNISAQKAAAEIEARIRILLPTLRPATKYHLKMREGIKLR